MKKRVERKRKERMTVTAKSEEGNRKKGFGKKIKISLINGTFCINTYYLLDTLAKNRKIKIIILTLHNLCFYFTNM